MSIPEQDMPGLANAIGPESSEYQYPWGRLGNAQGAIRHAWTGRCQLGRKGVDWPMPTKQDRPGLVNAPGSRQVGPRGKAGLDWSMPLGQDRPGLVNAYGAGQASTRICPWERQAWTC